MFKDTIEVFCNADTYTFDVPDPWPQCTDLAVCNPPQVSFGTWLMPSLYFFKKSNLRA